MSQLPVIVVMGVSGCGKSTVGKRLAKELKVPFFDADDYHPPANVEKMKKGTPLDDKDRMPWLLLLSELLAREASKSGIVLACSALKATYRELLSSIVPPRFVHLSLTPETATARLERRKQHFMPATLIQSQFDALEAPTDAITVDASQPMQEVIPKILRELQC